MQATKITKGLYHFKGYEIEKMEGGHWNLKPIGSSHWTDAAASLTEAKLLIQSWG